MNKNGRTIFGKASRFVTVVNKRSWAERGRSVCIPADGALRKYLV